MAAASPAARGPAQAAPRRRTALTPADYLKKILTARVYDVALETELERRGTEQGALCPAGVRAG